MTLSVSNEWNKWRIEDKEERKKKLGASLEN